MKADYFKGKRITLMGLGLLGRGVGDAQFLAQRSADLIVTDLKTEGELASSLELLKNVPNISYTLGRHEREDFRNRDLIIKGAGVPLDSPFVAEARKNGIPVRMSADLLVELAGVKTVGVTGTRGKSTVTHLIAHGLRRAGRHVLLGGNVRGISNLALLDEVRPETTLVLELDSWQLQGFGEARVSPNVAVFTNLMQDHRNYYSDEETYFSDKANIFRFQKPGDTLIAGSAVVEEWIQGAQPPVAPTVPVPLSEDVSLKLLGEHNRENAALASEALRTLGLTEEEMRDGLESFEPVQGRLQFLRELDHVKFYNDSNATTPEATIAALETLTTNDQRPTTKNIVLIAGGFDKGLDVSGLAETVNRACKAVLLLEGSGTQGLRVLLDPRFFIHDSANCSSLQAAVARAVRVAEPGDVILLSPAFASFGMFKNEYDRSEQFARAVADL